MDLEQPLRVNYFEGQYLRTQDFTDEQAYQLAMQRRHALAHHTWGIATGLALLTDDDGVLAVQPGVAVDGFGRDLVLADRVAIDPRLFDQRSSNVLDVWLLYGRTGSDPTPRGYGSCDDRDSVPFYRWREQPSVRVTVPDPAFPDRRQPAGLTEAELAFDATRQSPDDPERDWPVFLGQVRRNAPNATPPFTIDPSDRPYVGLVGDSVVAPSGLAWIALGHDPAVADDLAFAVHLDGPTAPQPSLAMDRSGNLDLAGRATIHGDAILDGSALAFLAPAAHLSTAHPWRIYRTDIDEGAIGRRIKSASGGDLPGKELRIEVAPDGSVVFGTWSPDKKVFRPCLTVGPDKVTVHGDLVVEGSIPPRVGAMRLDASAANATVSGLVGGATAAAMAADGDAQAVFGARIIPSPDMPHVLGVEALASDLPGQVNALVQHLKAHDPNLLEELKNAVNT
jgi:hypothetical protein